MKTTLISVQLPDTLLRTGAQIMARDVFTAFVARNLRAIGCHVGDYDFSHENIQAKWKPFLRSLPPMARSRFIENLRTAFTLHRATQGYAPTTRAYADPDIAKTARQAA